LFQNPASSNAPNSHAETPRRKVDPFIPKTEYIQKMRDPWVKNGIRPCASCNEEISCPQAKRRYWNLPERIAGFSRQTLLVSFQTMRTQSVAFCATRPLKAFMQNILFKMLNVG
jgi:hypothetical protein